MGKKVKNIDLENKTSKYNKGIIIALVFFILVVCAEGVYLVFKDNFKKDNYNISDSSLNKNEGTINLDEKKSVLRVLIDDEITQNEDNEEITNKLKEYKEKIDEVTEEDVNELEDEINSYIDSLEKENNEGNNVPEEKDEAEDSEAKKDNDDKNTATENNNQTSTGTNNKKPNTDGATNNKKPNTSGTTTNKKPNASLEKVLNSAPLNPVKTGVPDLDKKVEKIINSQTNSSMSTYQKVKALYDWVINDMDYSIPGIDLYEVKKMQNEYGLYDNDIIEVYFAREGFNSHSGSCDTYSAMFMILTRRLGLDSYTVGARNVKDGSGHVTVNIKLNGVWYDFDTQGEDNSKTKGKINYIFFGKRDSEIKKIYTYPHRNEDVASFKHFKKQSDSLETKVTIGGKTVSVVAYNQTQKVVNELIEIELNKGEPIPIKIESNHEVEYSWNNFAYNNGLMDFDDKAIGKIKSGTINYNFNWFQLIDFNLVLKDSKNREIIYVFRLNVKEKGGKFAVIMNSGNFKGNCVEINGSTRNSVGDVTYSAKVIETNDPKGINSPVITGGSPYYKFRISNIDYDKYYYIIEITAKDSVGNIAKTTYDIRQFPNKTNNK